MTTRTTGAPLPTRESATLRPIGYRQIHLDFHTSEHVGRVGDLFDAEHFASTLAAADVDHVNLFAKCHHSWCYYPTRAGEMHPGLDFDLFGQQIEACRRRGIVVGAYIPVGWSATDVARHPEWAAIGRDGLPMRLNLDLDAEPDDPRPSVSWIYLCPTGDYLDLVVAQVKEIAEYDPDGFWIDITALMPCYCPNCRAGMLAEGIDLDDVEAIQGYSRRRWQHANRTLSDAALATDATRWVFFNGTTWLHSNHAHDPAPVSGLPEINTHQDLEDLPTTWGGYDKLQLRARYFLARDQIITAMSGKFHLSWGNFGGYKTVRALEYETRLMTANGARCDFGDQLHPRGLIDAQTYSRIGEAFARTRRLVEYIDGVRPESRLALVLSRSGEDDEGVARVLAEQHREYVVPPATELDPARHDAVIVAGPVGHAERAALLDYGTRGGSIVLLGDAISGWQPSELADTFGIIEATPGTADGDYLAFQGALASLGEGLQYDYESGWRLKVVPEAEPLALLHDTYFDRTYARYVGHLNTPPLLEPSGFTALHRFGRHIVAAHALGRQYLRYGSEAHRDMLWRLVELVDPRPALQVDGLPAGGRVSLLHQPDRSRTLLHVLYAPIVQRGIVATVDDIPRIGGVVARLRLDRPVTVARDAEAGTELTLERLEDGSVSVTLPTVIMHRLIEFKHA
jgi:hypothetical protein